MKNVKLFEEFDRVDENATATDFAEVFNVLGYDGFDDFIEDNPGAVDALMEWMAGVPEFVNKLKEIDISNGVVFGYIEEGNQATAGDTLVTFDGFECVLEFGTYSNGVTAITLIEKSTGEPVATATVNLPEVNVPDGHVIIKNYAENVPEKGDDMLTVLGKAGVISKPVKMVGDINAPMCKLLKTS